MNTAFNRSINAAFLGSRGSVCKCNFFTSVCNLSITILRYLVEVLEIMNTNSDVFEGRQPTIAAFWTSPSYDNNASFQGTYLVGTLDVRSKTGLAGSQLESLKRCWIVARPFSFFEGTASSAPSEVRSQ